MANDTVGSKEHIVNAMAVKLVSDILKTCNAQSKIHGREFAHDLSTHFVACYIAALAYNILVFKPDRKMTEKQLFELVSNNFGELKLKIQEAISAGFTGAMKNHTGKEIEYYCVIRPIPPVANTKPC